jgi:hypothetical protein
MTDPTASRIGWGVLLGGEEHDQSSISPNTRSSTFVNGIAERLPLGQ